MSRANFQLLCGGNFWEQSDWRDVKKCGVFFEEEENGGNFWPTENLSSRKKMDSILMGKFFFEKKGTLLFERDWRVVTTPVGKICNEHPRDHGANLVLLKKLLLNLKILFLGSVAHLKQIQLFEGIFLSILEFIDWGYQRFCWLLKKWLNIQVWFSVKVLFEIENLVSGEIWELEN